MFTVLAAVTLLPALLGVFGMRVLSRRQRRRLAAAGRAPDAGGAVGALGGDRRTQARGPRRSRRAAVMVVLAIPVLSLRLGSSDQGNDPSSTTTRQAYDLLAEGFGPGFNGPAAAGGADHSAADAGRAPARWRTRLPEVADVTSVTPLAATAPAPRSSR